MKYTPEQINEFRRRHVAALRSDAYKQSFGALRKGKGFCCLGVGCDVVDSNGWTRLDDACYAHGSAGRTLRMSAEAQEGLVCASDPILTINGERAFATDFNDVKRLPFSLIADGFERYYAEHPVSEES